MELMILNAGQPLTMSSREIAELCEKQHKNVIRDIRVMLDELGDGSDLSHVQETKDMRGYTASICLPKDLTLTLIAGYNVRLRNRIIKRWMELEELAVAPALPDFSNPAAAARAWAEQFEQRQIVEQQIVALANQVAEQAPKVAAQERLALSDGELCLTDASKALGVPLGKFTRYLIRIGWAYRRQSNNRPVGYTVREQQGLVVHRPVTIYHKSGDVESSSQLLITPKGLARLAELIATGDVA